ncbi:hypothetical protein [Streptomyces sp. Root369]|uniref:hypothetical protein n=1 Tax=Streptomyces sp. Root369 TaxID=1736523 RepID=UPI001300FE82|nr:hypothetical protein [Streptomyces sp. Root369]
MSCASSARQPVSSGTGTPLVAQGRDDPGGEAQWAVNDRLGVPQRSGAFSALRSADCAAPLTR